MGSVRVAFITIGVVVAIVLLAVLGRACLEPNGLAQLMRPGELVGLDDLSRASFSGANGELAYATVVRNVGGTPLVVESVNPPPAGFVQTNAFLTPDVGPFNYPIGVDSDPERPLPAPLLVDEQAKFYVGYQIVDCDAIGDWEVGDDGMVRFTSWQSEPIVVSAKSGSRTSTVTVTESISLGRFEPEVCEG